MYTGSSGSPSLKASVSLGHTGLYAPRTLDCMQTPHWSPHHQTWKRWIPKTPGTLGPLRGCSTPSPTLEERDSPGTARPFKTGRAVTQPSSSCSSGSTAPLAQPQAWTSWTSAMLLGPRPALLWSPRGQPGLCFPRRGQVLSSAGTEPRGGLSAPGAWAPAPSLPEGGELVEGVPEERRLPLGLSQGEHLLLRQAAGHGDVALVDGPQALERGGRRAAAVAWGGGAEGQPLRSQASPKGRVPRAPRPTSSHISQEDSNSRPTNPLRCCVLDTDGLPEASPKPRPRPAQEAPRLGRSQKPGTGGAGRGRCVGGVAGRRTR